MPTEEMAVSSNSVSAEPSPGLQGCSVGGKSPDVVANRLTGGDPAHASTSSVSIEKPTRQTNKNRVRVLLLVDHGLFRASLGLLLASDQDLEIVGECDMSCNAPKLEVLRGSEADVALLEFVSDAEPGLEFISAAKNAGYQGRFLILTSLTDVRNLAMAFRLGASGIFLKTETPERLIQALKLVADGHIWIDHKIIELLVDCIADQPARLQEQACSSFQDDREHRVLVGIVNGLTNQKIGKNLGMSESAVKNVVQRLFSRTSVRRRSQLVRVALEGSFVTMGELGAPPHKQNR